MIPATRVGAVTFPPRSPRDTRTQRTCSRCGRSRQVNRGDRQRLCGDCTLIVADLGETHRWEAP